MSTSSFAKNLRIARKQAELTQQGMADLMLIPKRTIENWEAGGRTPPPYVQRFVLNELRSIKGDEKSGQN
jgi:DNA-binding transcriptional regulator YiaG